jgi:hypothetical protein
MMRALAWLALCCALPAHAIDRIRIRAESVSAAGFGLRGVDATLQIRSAARSTVELHAARAVLPAAIEAQTGTLSNLRLQCTDPVVHEPRFECPAFTAQASSSRWPAIHAAGKTGFRSDTGAWSASGGGLQLAGRPLSFTMEGDPVSMQAGFTLHGLQLPQVKEFLVAQKLPVPELTLTGNADIDAHVARQGERLTTDITLSITDGGYQNADFTLIGEKLAATVRASADLTSKPITFEARIAGSKGQALAGPVLLDFDLNPLQLSASGSYSPAALQITRFRSEQRDLATLTGSAHLELAPFKVKEALIDAADVRFPAAYTSFMQITLATTPFNQLEAAGAATLHAAIRDNLPVQVDLAVKDLAFSDASRNLKVGGVSSEVHWSRGLTGPPRPSWLSWENSQGWGIVGARSRLDFIAQDRAFRLVQPARLPFFDGALRINTLAVDQIGTEAVNGVFDAVIEPISMAPIAKALGLPEFAGKLAGTIPGLTYKDKVLSLQGNIEADVFGGRVVASNLRISEPLGAWPRLHGDIIARNLDLDLLTSTFRFGGITGRLDVDLIGLETFNWSPVAFDLTMATPKGDKSRHRISQRAVQNLSDFGGGGGGVASVMQSPFLKFFDDFGYERLGISCRLRNDICQMGGVGAAGAGFYILKGQGLPRIDIIGNNPLVDWPRLLAQVREAVLNPENIEFNPDSKEVK